MDGSTMLTTAAPDMLAAPAQDYSNLFVCLMGMGTVFVGLICLIVLITIMGRICQKGLEKSAAPAAPVAAAPVVSAAPAQKQELLAAITAAIAEDMGTDPGAFRIVSIKKL